MKENKEITEENVEATIPRLVNPEERNAKSIRKVFLWLFILGIILVFGIMISETQDKAEPNSTEVEMYQEQLDNDADNKVIDMLTSPNGMYSEEAPEATGTHIMDKAWRGDDTATVNKEVDVDALNDFQDKIIEE